MNSIIVKDVKCPGCKGTDIRRSKVNAIYFRCQTCGRWFTNLTGIHTIKKGGKTKWLN